MTKEQKIEEYLKKPFEVGDAVIAKIPFTTKSREKIKNKWIEKDIEGVDTLNGIIHTIKEDTFTIKTRDSRKTYGDCVYLKDGEKLYEVSKSYVVYDTSHIGADCFITKDWNSKIEYWGSTLDNIFMMLRLKYKDEDPLDFDEKIEWNPTVIVNDKETPYQRDLVWTLQEKQLLIESIYNDIDIGKFVIRTRPFEYFYGKNKGSKDIVDGKQRLHTLYEFVNDEFPDINGNYWSDFSKIAQRKFFRFGRLTYGQIGETATDEEVLKIFLNINFAGVQMSVEHINYVKSLL